MVFDDDYLLEGEEKELLRELNSYDTWTYYQGEDYDELRREDYGLLESGGWWDEEPTYMGVPIRPRDWDEDPVLRELYNMMDKLPDEVERSDE